ncbi:MAG: hypothetical protein U1E36_05700 [Rickettsiales bacterium]
MLFAPFVTVVAVSVLAASPALAQYLNQTPPDHYVPSIGSAPSQQPTSNTASSGSYYGGSSNSAYSNPSTSGYGQPAYNQQAAPVYAPNPDPNYSPPVQPPAPAPSYNGAAPAAGYQAPAIGFTGGYNVPSPPPPPPPPPAPSYNNAAPAPQQGFSPQPFGGNAAPPGVGYSAPMGQAPDSNTNGDFVSGGVGSSDQARMQSIEKDYTLKVLFAGKNGDYLAIVNASITDKEGNTLYNQATDGPILLARLKPGTYKIHAELDGNTADTTVSVGKSLRSIIVRL